VQTLKINLIVQLKLLEKQESSHYKIHSLEKIIGREVDEVKEKKERDSENKFIKLR
jgi:hypothetical protein